MSAALLSPGQAGRNRNLLVVDDDRMQLLLMTGMARRCGFVADGARSIDEALRQLQTRDYGTVALDLSLGEADGVELIRRIAEIGQQPNLLIISGFDERIRDSAVRVAQRHGLSTLGTLRKPISFVDVHRALQAAASAAEISHAAAGPPAGIDPQMLRRAIEAGEIGPVYQPEIELRTGRIVMVEALARWTSPEHGAIPPSVFVPLAESAGLSAALTTAMMEAALHDAMRWRALAPHLGVAVNVPASALVDVGWPDRIDRILAQANLPPGILTVEITETVATSESPVISDILTRLRIKGCQLALDDFGTGYASLLTLLRLPFSVLKLDRSFVQSCDQDAYALNIVHAMLSLAQGFGMTSVAEGVETEAVAGLLAEAGCDLAQGFLFARPMPVGELIALLDSDRQGFAAGLGLVEAGLAAAG